MELVGEHPRKHAVLDLLQAKAPWAVTRWVSQAVPRFSGGSGATSEIAKLELEQLDDSYFFVSIIVRERDMSGLEVPEDAKTRLLPSSLIPS